MSPPSPEHIAQFAQGYYNFRQGKLKDASEAFERLAHNKEHHLWGDIGMLVYAHYTGSISNMREPLLSAEGEAKGDPSLLRKWSVPFYEAWYCSDSGRDDRVWAILAEPGSSLDPFQVAELKAYLLLKGDKFDEAQDIIKSMPPEYQLTASLESTLIELRYGNKKWLDYLRRKRKECPQFWVIERQYGDALIAGGDVSAGLEILKKLVDSRTFDFNVQLDYAAQRLYHVKDETAAQYLLQLNYPSDLTKYDVLLSQLYLDRKMYAESERQLMIAKKLFPRSYDVLLGILTLSIEQRDNDRAYQAARELLEVYPNDIGALLLSMEAYCFRHEYDKARAMENRIKESKRYVDDRVLEGVKLLDQKFHLGGPQRGRN
jgi:hypothetical protein